MHQERTFSVFDLLAAHEIGRDLKQRRKSLDEHRNLLGLVAEELRRHGPNRFGPRHGLATEAVLQHRQLSCPAVTLTHHLDHAMPAISVFFGR